MKLPLAPQAETALGILQGAGYEAWIVGGCVRDLLLGRTPEDFDLCTAARPEEVKDVFAGHRIVETGLRHGTVTVLVEGMPLEITTYRVESGSADARHPDQLRFTHSLREDAARRDFTVNAMAYAPGRGLQDFYGGQGDLKKGLLRCVGEPDRRFQEDALRILRALRFSATLGFAIEGETLAAARRQKGLLVRLSAERVAGELGKLLVGQGAKGVLLDYPDLLGVVLPELLPMVGLDQRNVHHCYDLLTHTAVAVDHTPPQLALRLAALFHDCGKPACFSLGEDGQGHFYGHARESAALAETALRRLRCPNKLRERVVKLIRYHDSPVEEKLLRRWLNRLGEEDFFALLALQRADSLALAPAYRGRVEALDGIEAQARKLLQEAPCLTLRDLAVNGRDLMALGLEGRAIGAALDRLLTAVLVGSLANERAALLQSLTDFDARNTDKKEKK